MKWSGQIVYEVDEVKGLRTVLSTQMQHRDKSERSKMKCWSRIVSGGIW